MTALCAEKHRICKVTLVIRILPDFASQVLRQMRQVTRVHGNDPDAILSIGGRLLHDAAII